MQECSGITQRGDYWVIEIQGRAIECETYSAALDMLNDDVE